MGPSDCNFQESRKETNHSYFVYILPADSKYYPFCCKNNEGIVLLRREISIKVICEKVQFSNCDFYNHVVTMNGHII